MSPLTQSLTTSGGIRTTVLLQLLISVYTISTVSGDSYRQSWIAPEQLIPMDEMKADCHTGELSEVKVSLQGIPAENQCAKQGISFIASYKLYLQQQITECFNDARCTQFYWNRDGFVFGCESQAEEEILQQSLQLIVSVTCDIPNTLHVYSIDSNTNINASRPLCSDGHHQMIQHIFTINHCPKPMVLGHEAWSALYDLASTMEQCGELCPLIDTSKFKLQTLECQGQTEVKNVGLGIYWSCDQSATRPLRTTATPNNLTESDIGSQTGAEATSDKQAGLADKYLVALIVTSLLFALCFCALVIVLVYFLYCKPKKLDRRFTMPAGRPPPSKDTLYGKSRGSSRRKLLSSRTPSSASSERYVSEREHNSRNAEIAKLDEDYAVPLVIGGVGSEDMADRVIYENEDDTYEVVDIEKPTMSPPQRTNTTQSGYTVMGKKPTRDNSEKYSDGYLIPTAMRKNKTSN